MNLDLFYRQAVLSVAGNPKVEALIKTRARSLVRRYVAGETLEEALVVAERLEAQGVHAILDLLGEMVRSEEEARTFQRGILELVRKVAAYPWPKYVSLKLTQLGLDLGEGLALSLMREILKEAEPKGVFIRIDMEDSPRVEATLRIYKFAADYARERGIILADTKFEFGTDADGRLYIMDEMLTPDSSRYWPADEYEVGTSPPSYDKQFVRDYLETLDWGKTAPGPSIPAGIIERTRAKYAEALQRLAGISVD